MLRQEPPCQTTMLMSLWTDGMRKPTCVICPTVLRTATGSEQSAARAPQCFQSLHSMTSGKGLRPQHLLLAPVLPPQRIKTDHLGEWTLMSKKARRRDSLGQENSLCCHYTPAGSWREGQKALTHRS